MRLKGIKIKVAIDGTVRVTPLFFGQKGSTITVPKMAGVGTVLSEVIGRVLAQVKSARNRGG